MSHETEEEVEESFEEFDDGFDPGLDDDIEIDEDFDDEEEAEEDFVPAKSSSKKDSDLVDANYADVVKANPKRLSTAQQKQAASVIEGIISHAELSDPEGQARAWKKLSDTFGSAHARAYSIATELTENDVIDHPRFGVGFVVQLLTPTKVEVIFEDGLKKLAHNLQR
ncbi:hypothetical protein DL240_16225 [Lujinxingia litoralis]|uniref:Uncharacterized protein n=1 Tax=Lujinxingia litoralis TaxID=2211119 RepID=A0A328C5K3_9DELT|nr:hypothetical protein [Lujinxingia litoralis]RAL20583.1 hypothetical protein DL240_16225 [Lujinxingia litoralis]